MYKVKDKVKKPTLFAVGMGPTTTCWLLEIIDTAAVLNIGRRQTKREQRKVAIVSVCLLQSSYLSLIFTTNIGL